MIKFKDISNVVLISIDTLAAKHVSCYGYKGNTTPFLDTVSRNGVRLEKMTSPCPVTLPAHTSMFTCLYPAWNEAGLFNMNKVNHDDEETFWVDKLREAGVNTGAFVSAIVLKEQFTGKFGFQHYNDEMTCSELNRPQSLRRRSDETLEMAKNWIENNDEPFFSFIHLMDVHGTYDVDKPVAKQYVKENYEGKELPLKGDFRPNSIPDFYSLEELDDFPGKHYGEYYKDKYDGCIKYVDKCIENFTEQVKEEVDGNVIFIVCADHGEEFGENNYWCMHSHGTVKNQIHVPFIMWGNDIEGGKIDHNSVYSLKDIGATVLDLFDINDEFNHGKSIFNNNEKTVFSLTHSQGAIIDNNGAIMLGNILTTDEISEWDFNLYNKRKFLWNTNNVISEREAIRDLRFFLDVSKIANKEVDRAHFNEKQKKHEVIIEKMAALGYVYGSKEKIERNQREVYIKENLTPLWNEDSYNISRNRIKNLIDKLRTSKGYLDIKNSLDKNDVQTFYRVP